MSGRSGVRRWTTTLRYSGATWSMLPPKIFRSIAETWACPWTFLPGLGPVKEAQVGGLLCCRSRTWSPEHAVFRRGKDLLADLCLVEEYGSRSCPFLVRGAYHTSTEVCVSGDLWAEILDLITVVDTTEKM
eukprot:g74575.t1